MNSKKRFRQTIPVRASTTRYCSIQIALLASIAIVPSLTFHVTEAQRELPNALAATDRESSSTKAVYGDKANPSKPFYSDNVSAVEAKKLKLVYYLQFVSKQGDDTQMTVLVPNEVNHGAKSEEPKSQSFLKRTSLAIKPFGKTVAGALVHSGVKAEPPDSASTSSVQSQVGLCQTPIKYESRNQIDPPQLLISDVLGHVIAEAGDSEALVKEIGPVNGACVGIFTEQGHQLYAVTVANDKGYFKFEGVPPGQYRLVVRADPLCVANVPLLVVTAKKNKRSRGQIVVHMRAAGSDSCSYGDYGTRPPQAGPVAATTKPEQTSEPLLQRTALFSRNAYLDAGTVVGSMAFVDDRSPNTSGDAANVTVELEHEGDVVLLVSNDHGDYVKDFATGTYCLKTARDANGSQLRFSPRQHACFKVRSNKDTRFDVMLVSNVVAGKPFQNTSTQQESVPVKAVAPIYPLIASASGVTGAVTVEVEIDQRGVVTSVRSIEGPKVLQAAAKHSASQWRFNTAEGATGKRVARLTFVFDLVSGNPPAVELVPSFFPPYRIEVKGAKPNFIQRVDSDPPMLERGKNAVKSSKPNE